ncbi:MAG TPA: ankyrin repeat domain-containing protein [Vicinamibacterales bacterium]|nr:ankyrin repeat domain-containing protein [Vicinamibacterales bacterium]
MRTLSLPILVLCVAAAAPALAQTQLPPPASRTVDYEADFKPILSQNCYSCPGLEAQQSGLRLDLRQPALRGGDYGPVITPGNSADSKLIRRLVHGDGGLQMPPTGPLSDEEIGILRAWIDQGAEFRTEIRAEAPPRPVDPKAAAVIAAVRSRDRATLASLIAGDPALVRSADTGGSTPLHHAAGFGTVESLGLLIDKGADVNAKNRRGSTPLFWAIHDEAKVRLLVSRGATINVKQIEGRTPVYQAALLSSGNGVLRYLLDNGGDPNVATLTGLTPLNAASLRGDVDAMRMLLDKGARVDSKNGAGATPLMAAAANGNPAAVQLLLDKGADVQVRTKLGETALGNAAGAGVTETVTLLLDRGADVNSRNSRGYSPLMLAAGSDVMNADIVKLLLAKGADTSFSADYDETAQVLASRRGNTAVTRLLGGVPADLVQRDNIVAAHNVARTASPRMAIERALPLLEKQSHNFIRIGGCNSCHAQDLVSAAAAIARDKGLAAPREIAQLPQSMMPSPERLMDFNVVAVPGVAWELFDFGMNKLPKTPYTDAVVRIITATQTAAGNWSTIENRRPPMTSGDFQVVALAIYSLKHYGPDDDKATTDAAMAKAVKWLERAKPETTQDRAFHLLGLAWGNGSSAAIKSAARGLAALQRADGGWSQLPEMVSDAYATGEALYALNSAGNMRISNAVYQRGVDYLLRTQAPDGSWRVQTRAIWLQPYFESGFPYGRDQFISAAGTAWAVMALTPAADTGRLITAR